MVLHEIMTREVRNIKKEQNQKRDHSQLQTKQHQIYDDNSGTPVDFFIKIMVHKCSVLTIP